jgi:hypothetical protein
MTEATTAYSRKYYQEHKDKYKEHNKKYHKANREKIAIRNKAWRDANKEKKLRITDWLIERYGNIPCMDCNKVWPWCAMDFDHRPEEIKEFGIGTKGDLKATSERTAQIEKEIAKCDLVCASCHRVRTSRR